MADRVEIIDVSCPASTPATSPIEVSTAFNPGIVEKVWVVIPDGHSGLTGIALAVGHQPCIPENVKLTPSAQWRFIEGNDESIPFDLENYPDSGAWSAFLFNTDLNPHSWQLRFEIRELTRGVVAVGGAPGAVSAVEGLGGEPVSAGTPTGSEQPQAGQPTPETGPPEPSPLPESTAPPEATPPPEAAQPPEGLGPAPTEPGEVELAAPPEVGEGPPEPLGPGEGVPGAAAPGARRPAARRPPARRPAPRRGTRVVTTHETRPAGGWLPHGARFELKQLDQGQDFITNWRGPIIAPGDGFVVRVLSDRPFPAGFGPRYPVVRITTGPWAGEDYYIGHTTAAVHAGEHFREGHTLAHADQGHREGGGWVELGLAPGGYPGPMGEGRRLAGRFTTRTITRHHTVAAPAPRTAPAHPGKPKPGTRRKPAPAHRPPGARPGAPPGRPAPRPGSRPSAPSRPAAGAHGPVSSPRRAPAPAPPRVSQPPARRAPAPAPRPAPRRAPPPPRRHR